MTWKQVGAGFGVSAATAMYLSRATPAAVLDDDLARLERLLYLIAAMTGLRQGELLGLRWRDIDWPAQRSASSTPMSAARTPRSTTSCC